MKKMAATLALVTATVLASSTAQARHHHYKVHHRQYYAYTYATEGQIVSHPSGCPRTAFCGCGASVELFGHPIRELYLASNWFRFPHASPAPGMVAVRNHHVFVIRSVNGDGTVVAYDANSGGHQTRVHTVSLSGYSVRNPHAEGFSREPRSLRGRVHVTAYEGAGFGGPASATFGAGL